MRGRGDAGRFPLPLSVWTVRDRFPRVSERERRIERMWTRCVPVMEWSASSVRGDVIVRTRRRGCIVRPFLTPRHESEGAANVWANFIQIRSFVQLCMLYNWGMIISLSTGPQLYEVAKTAVRIRFKGYAARYGNFDPATRKFRAAQPVYSPPHIGI